MELTVKQVGVTIKKKMIVANIDLHVKEKQFVGIIGANGCGKSTLLKSIYKSITPQTGSVYLDNLNVLKAPNKEVAKSLGVVGQFNEMSFDLTVEQMVLLGRTPHKRLMETDTSSDHEKVEAALVQTNLIDFRKRSYLSLSGGEKQRVILARALAQEPQVMILDEPVNHLDIRYQLEIMEIVKKLDITVLTVLHDLEMTNQYCDYIYGMKAGQVIAQGTPKEVLTAPLIKDIYQVDCQLFENPITNKLGFVYSI